jgi:hypothetical protein
MVVDELDQIVVDGLEFIRANDIVALPIGGYTRFAKITKDGGVDTGLTYPDGTPVRGVEIENDGWSSKDMMYGKPVVLGGSQVSLVYLLHDGEVYVATIREA